MASRQRLSQRSKPNVSGDENRARRAPAEGSLWSNHRSSRRAGRRLGGTEGGFVDRRIDGSLENGSLSVLVVDDDDLQRQFLARLLARAGIGPLFWATNGRSALEAFREGQAIDVVVCDLLM